MSIINLQDLLRIDDTLFDGIPLPENIDRDILENAILRRCISLTPIYTDTRTFKAFTQIFFQTHESIIRKLMATVLLTYDPIENYDRYEEIEREESLTAGIGNELKRQYGSSDTDSSEDSVSAFDSDTYSPSTKRTATSSKGGVDTDTNTRSGQDVTKEKISNHMHGNIGVTTSQQMIEAERKVAVFNVYDTVARMFEVEMFIGIY